MSIYWGYLISIRAFFPQQWRQSNAGAGANPANSGSISRGDANMSDGGPGGPNRAGYANQLNQDNFGGNSGGNRYRE